MYRQVRKEVATASRDCAAPALLPPCTPYNRLSIPRPVLIQANKKYVLIPETLLLAQGKSAKAERKDQITMQALTAHTVEERDAIIEGALAPAPDPKFYQGQSSGF
eukprot:SAG31_NODE_1750_length_7353_cov_17.309209_10_plen_106_part_00